jgi:hypothetical protein
MKISHPPVWRLLMIFVLFCSNGLSFMIQKIGNNRKFAPSQYRWNDIKLSARVARKQEEQQKEEAGDNEMVELPFSGLIGAEQGGLFDNPVNIFDPIKDTDSLPGEDGSDEKIAAIQKRIQERVQELKKAGEWEITNEEFGGNPLEKIPIWQTMIYQVQNCKPFESYGELALTYSLVLTTSLFIIGILLFSKITFESFITWYINTDFDFMSGLIRGD